MPTRWENLRSNSRIASLATSTRSPNWPRNSKRTASIWSISSCVTLASIDAQYSPKSTKASATFVAIRLESEWLAAEMSLTNVDNFCSLSFATTCSSDLLITSGRSDGIWPSIFAATEKASFASCSLIPEMSWSMISAIWLARFALSNSENDFTCRLRLDAVNSSSVGSITSSSSFFCSCPTAKSVADSITSKSASSFCKFDARVQISSSVSTPSSACMTEGSTPSGLSAAPLERTSALSRTTSNPTNFWSNWFLSHFRIEAKRWSFVTFSPQKFLATLVA